MRNTHSGNHYLRAVSWIVERLTGDPFDEWLNERLNAGDSYRTIARDLATLTDDVVDVTGESVRRWVLEFDELKAAA
jgi:hypothetical protein